LIAGVDESGPHIYETCPDANYYEYYAFSIGARCQSAKTYLENNFQDFEGAGLEELIRHGLKAIRKSTPNEIELTGDNVSVSVVAYDHPFEIMTEDSLRPYLDEIAAEMQAEMQVEEEQPAAE
jgi:20S proteasome subunit alpha 6